MFVNPLAPYQPRFTSAEFELLKQLRLDDLECSISSTLVEGAYARCGRLCVDRLKLIFETLSTEIGELSFLDLGCANGMFCIGLKALGARRVIGIDNDQHSHTLKMEISHCLDQGREDALKFGLDVEFLDRNLLTVMQTRDCDLECDVVMSLSVFHHLFLGYGYLPSDAPMVVLGDRAQFFFRWVEEHCKKYFIFETHENVFADWGPSQIADNLLATRIFESVRCLGETVGFDGKTRGLWLCSR